LAQVGVKRDLTIFRGKAHYIALYRDAQSLQSGALYRAISRSIAMYSHFNQARYLAP
jgi:Iap family predicted aminopeptidase